LECRAFAKDQSEKLLAVWLANHIVLDGFTVRQVSYRLNCTMNRRSLLLSLALYAACLCVCPTPARAQTNLVPEWIWYPHPGAKAEANETVYLRRAFTLDAKVESAGLTVACDNECEVFLNDKSVGTVKDWKTPARLDVGAALRTGPNLLAIRGRNRDGNTAGVLAQLDIRLAGGQSLRIVSDPSWKASLKNEENWQTIAFGPAGWVAPASLGKLGMSPWGEVFKEAPRKVATPAESLTTLPGFKVELIRAAEPGEGSWVCMTVDILGRLIVSPQENPNPTNGGMMRFTFSREGKLMKSEKLGVNIGGAQGLLYAHQSLYVNGTGPDGNGLYRLRDLNYDGRYDDVKFLQKLTGRGEHGPHAVVLGPDKMLYIMNGNFVPQITNLAGNSPHRNYAEDQLLPRQPDGNGFGNKMLPPGGHVLRTDPEGKNWEIMSGGFRNAYDMAFNADGELFTFDSDMEWDVGAPWYRPTRILHVVTGGDYGFREGTGKWPNWYPDSLPTLVDIGLGSPTGMKFGTGSKFPPKYKRALFALDWAYGRILAVHLTPKGATYTGTFEPFITGKPLNVTDVEFGNDGAMYFITGGRGTQSGLYRVTYTEEATAERQLTKAEIKSEDQAAGARLVRQSLEGYAGRNDPKAVELAWRHLDSEDRWLRYAARIVLESQPVDLWKLRALKESKPRATITAMLALARMGDTNDLFSILKNLGRVPYNSLDEALKLELLRTYSVALVRQGRPADWQAAELIARFDPVYPSTSEPINRELCQLLVYLGAPTVTTKTMVLLKYAATQQEQMHYIFTLRNVKDGWSAEDREEYFKWFGKARREFKGGNSFGKFLAAIKTDAAGTLGDTEKIALAAWLKDDTNAPVLAKAAPRPFVKEWKVDDLTASLDQAGKGRSFEKGRKAFADLMCLQCHRFGNDGGSTGPDITAAASRFNRRDLLEAILDPSKVISDQYQNFNIVKRDGKEYTGTIAEEDDRKLVMVYNPLEPQRVEILKADIEKRAPSKVSPMPEGLVNGLTRDELLDLLAYIESGGKQKSAAFK
jgi:putative heme-binding domain-containing protein